MMQSSGLDADSTTDDLIAVISTFTLNALMDSEQRRQHKELCAERLAAQDNVEVQYAEQAVLANLDWGIDALEEAILTSNEETKKARLEHAEKMLQVSALLDIRHTTAGIPNSYLSAWAHLNLALVWKLRGNDENTAAHMLEMFLVEPLYSRVDFAPNLWEQLFLPHLTSIVSWYTEQRHNILSSILLDSVELSYSKEDISYNVSEYKNFLSGVSPEQATQLQHLEQLYQDSLDDNTRLYARYYKECLNFDPSLAAKKNMPLMPIAEPPMTPMHELSHIPQSVKFGPQPPTSAGFSHSNFSGFTTVYTSNNDSQQPPTMIDEHKIRQEAVYKFGDGTQSQIWEEEDELDDSTYEAQEGLRSVDSHMVAKHGSSFTCQQPQGIMYSSKDSPHGSKGDGLSPSVQGPSKVFRHQKAPQGKSGSSKPLLSLFQDQDSVIISSSRSLSFEEESSSSSGDLQEGLQEDEEYKDTAIQNMESCITTRDAESDRTPEDAEVYDNDAIQLQKLRERQEGVEAEDMSKQTETEMSLPVIAGEKDLGQNLSHLKLPNISTPVTRPPKDFVCPITSQIFNDPVTLETGQTYERRAIQEWLDRGSMTCPITRQTLRSTSLPKTNYVLKRVIAAWKEQHPELALEFGSSENSPCLPRPQQSYASNEHTDQATDRAAGSPDSLHIGLTSRSYNSPRGRPTPVRNMRVPNVLSSPRHTISQDSLQDLVNKLKPMVACLCDSEDLLECEPAVLGIAHIWQKSKGNHSIQQLLTKDEVIKGLIEVLSMSEDTRVHAAATFILSELLIQRDGFVLQSIAKQDPEFDSLIGLLRRGIVPTTVLLYQLKLAPSRLDAAVLQSLVAILRRCEIEYSQCEDPFPMCMGPKEAACLMLDQMFAAANSNTKSAYAQSVISMEGLSPLIDSLEATGLNERTSAVSILLCCMQTNGSCRNYIAHRAQLTPVLELLHRGSERGRTLTISFLLELVRLNRRSINNQILQVIKEEGSLSTMHVLLVHLQRVPLEQRPMIASLLLQLDLLVQPRKGSMYREEAIETLIGAVTNKDNLAAQVAAGEILLCLGGRFSFLGKPLMELWLLRTVGLDQAYNSTLKAEHQLLKEGDMQVNKEEEEKAAREWEKRVAGALVSFENGLLLEALGRAMKSQTAALAKTCFISLTWLLHMLPLLPDTGVQEKVRKSLMPEFLSNLKSSKGMEDKALAVLAIGSFLEDSEGLQDIVLCAKDISGPLRELRSSLPMANNILRKLIGSPLVNAPEFWSHEDLSPLIDASVNGEVRCLGQAHGRVFTGHSDGTLKVWECKKKSMNLIRDVREHQKSLMCLHASPSGDKLYTGSLDRTVRVWSLGHDELNCMKVHDMKEAVQSLVANSALFCCAAPQGSGIRVLQGEMGVKSLMPNKHVQSIAMGNGKLYCGCTDNSIQDTDVAGGPPGLLQQGMRTLLGKKAVYALQVFDGKLYSAGSSVDGVAAKVWSLKDKTLIGQLATSLDIRAMAVNDEFVYLGSSTGAIEVWLRERLVKVATMNIGSKVTALLAHENILFSGSEDGKIRRWSVG